MPTNWVTCSLRQQLHLSQLAVPGWLLCEFFQEMEEKHNNATRRQQLSTKCWLLTYCDVWPILCPKNVLKMLSSGYQTRHTNEFSVKLLPPHQSQEGTLWWSPRPHLLPVLLLPLCFCAPACPVMPQISPSAPHSWCNRIHHSRGPDRTACSTWSCTIYPNLEHSPLSLDKPPVHNFW